MVNATLDEWWILRLDPPRDALEQSGAVCAVVLSLVTQQGRLRTPTGYSCTYGIRSMTKEDRRDGATMSFLKDDKIYGVQFNEDQRSSKQRRQ